MTGVVVSTQQYVEHVNIKQVINEVRGQKEFHFLRI